MLQSVASTEIDRPCRIDAPRNDRSGNTARETVKGMQVAILVTDGFEQVELCKPRLALDEAAAAAVAVRWRSPF